MNYYIGLDLGTSGVKGVVFDSKGNIYTSYLAEYDIISICDGYAEEDPNIWYEKTLEVLDKISKLDIAKGIKGLGISGQMHGLVLLDNNDNVLRNSIIWCDNRTSNEAKYLEEVLGKDYIKSITSNIPIPAFTLSKLLWVKNNEADIFNKINKAMLPKDYIAYMLTSNYYAEYSDNSGMQIIDMNALEYSKELLNKLDINPNIFGKMIKSIDSRGHLIKPLQDRFNMDFIVVGGGGDQACGAIGAGVINEGDLMISLGSSGVVLAPTNSLVVLDGELQTFLSCEYKRYFLMGCTNGCGTSLKWLRDNILDINYNEMNILANDITNNKLFYLPYLMGERTPILDNDAKGVFFGLTNTTTKADMIRAVMEGVAYSIYDAYRLIPNEINRVVIIGGGAKSDLYLNMISSMIDKPINKIKQDEGASLGAAILAMVANMEYNNINDAINNIIEISDTIYPSKSLHNQYMKGYNIYKKIYNNTKEIFKEIKEL